MLSLEIFDKEIKKLCAVYDKDLSEPAMELYYQCLSDLSDDDFCRAVKTVASSNKYNTLPKPAEFLEIINGTSKDNQSKDDILATQALLKLEEGIAKHGYYDSVQFDDPRIHKAIEHMGGWMRVSSQEAEEWTWSKKEFVKIYKALLHRPIDESYPTKVTGFLEQDNINRGTIERLAEHLKPKTVYIGKPKVIAIESKKKSEGAECLKVM